MRLGLVLGLALVVSGCEVTTVQTGKPPRNRPAPMQPAPPASVAAKSFTEVVSRMEPVAERMCRSRAPNANCDYQIVVDTRPGQPANAYQTVDKTGRPIIAFNLALIAEVRNEDELAFVMGHEAAHHIEGHLSRTRDTAMAGDAIGGIFGAAMGADANTIGVLQNIGAGFGSRIFSKDFELEADELGTIITYRAGFDPLVGAQFFTRIPDPGNQFLGTHPPNKDRIKTVRRTMADLR
jgi:Zn-dependent protease with chaperone function